MKLLGSLSEQREREQLVASNASLRAGESPLAKTLLGRGVDLTAAYLLEWIPEQCEDIFVVLVGGDRIVRLELIRDEGVVATFDESPVAAYKPGTKHGHLRLAVALGLLSSTP
jgi:hypothetical protein